MDVNLTLESERFTGIGVVRAFFLIDGKETHVHTETVTMYRQTDPHFKCTDIQAYIIVSTAPTAHYALYYACIGGLEALPRWCGLGHSSEAKNEAIFKN